MFLFSRVAPPSPPLLLFDVRSTFTVGSGWPSVLAFFFYVIDWTMHRGTRPLSRSFDLRGCLLKVDRES